MTKTKQKAKGTCFTDSYLLIQKFGELSKDARLVHGIVFHPITGWHSHGWVETHGFCFDFVKGNMVSVPQERYYELGKVKTGEGEIFKYTKSEAVKLSLKTGKYYFSKLPCKY